MDHSGAGGGRGFCLDAADEAQKASGVKRYSMIRPTSEMKLTDLSDFCYAPLRKQQQIMDQDETGLVLELQSLNSRLVQLQ